MREFSCLLDMEVPGPSRGGTAVPVALQAIAKFGFPRVVMVQQMVLRSLELYRRTERAAVVARCGPVLWRRRADLFVVDDVDGRGMRLSGRLHWMPPERGAAFQRQQQRSQPCPSPGTSHQGHGGW
ncbi:hypothetical protein [Streptomyces sp. NPDC056660]|uniref:hypothetical protein n=1 Tax=Streptomyces sp. NPDC056660 TaxID=3345897 RepID=UPI0036BD0ED8